MALFEPTPDYYDSAHRRAVDPDRPGRLRNSAAASNWWECIGRRRRTAAETRWGFYTPEPIRTKPRNRYRSPVPTVTGE